jgi:hypothetical protein
VFHPDVLHQWAYDYLYDLLGVHYLQRELGLKPTSQHRLIIRTLAEDPSLRISVGKVAAKVGVNRSAVYRVLWRFQFIKAVRAHGRGWSKVEARWRRGPEEMIEDYEVLADATPITGRSLNYGRIRDAFRHFKHE